MPASHRRLVTPDTALAPPDGFDDEDAETGPVRRCAVTRERLPKTQLIRFVLAPDRSVVADLAERLPGRGIWLRVRRDVVETARARGAFAKAARGPVTVPADLVGTLQAALAQRIGDQLGLARRAGQAVAGYDKAREWLRRGQAGVVLQARDGSVDERKRFLSGAPEGVGVHAPLSAAALGAVFGRDRAVHVVVAPGALADRIGIECMRLAGLAPEPAADDKTGGNGIGPADARRCGVWDA